MTLYKYDDTLALLKKVAEGKEDFVYTPVNGACVNWVADENGDRVGSCIVGQAIESIGAINAIPDRGSVSPTLVQLDGVAKIQFSDKARRLLMEVQTKQDNGIAWGEAIENSASYMSSDEVWDDNSVTRF